MAVQVADFGQGLVDVVEVDAEEADEAVRVGIDAIDDRLIGDATQVAGADGGAADDDALGDAGPVHLGE